MIYYRQSDKTILKFFLRQSANLPKIKINMERKGLCRQLKEIQIISLLCFGMAAMLSDLQSGKIPNCLIVTGLSCALFYQWMEYGFIGWVMFLGGCFLPVLVLGGLYYFRMIGAGDIKLFCMIGGFIGPEKCLECMILAVLFGGIISLMSAIRCKNLGQRLIYLGTYISDWTECKVWKSYMDGVDENAKFCFSVPVMLSVLCYIKVSLFI